MRLHSSPYFSRLDILPSLIFFLVLVLVLLGASEAYSTLSEKSLRSLPSPGSDFDIHNGTLLAPILRPRVPGSPGSAAVLEHFASFFRTVLPEWHVEFQNSTSKTPATGNTDLPFVNLIARRDPPWAAEGEVGRLTLAAHYDSKMDPPGFIGAIDSAAPCAMILYAARTVNDALSKKWARMRAEGAADHAGLGDEKKGVQIILLDGEEAFKQWSETDSLYGARSLAEHWDKTTHPALSTYRTPLSSITLFMLLDLLGSANPVIPSYFRTTHWAYKHLATLERRLRSLSMFKSSPNYPAKHQHHHPLPRNQEEKKQDQPQSEPVFLPDAHKDDLMAVGGNKNSNGIESPFALQGTILDDHVPFMERGVEVLHLIPASFPSIWHTIDDDGAHLDLDTVEDWAILVAAFVAEWMDLEGFMPSSGGGGSTSTLTNTAATASVSPQPATGKRTELNRAEAKVVESESLFRRVGKLVHRKIVSKTEL